MSAAKDVVPLHTRVRNTSLHLETPAEVFQEYPTASSSESFLHEEDSRARGGCQWQGLALLRYPGPPASSLVWGPGWSAAASLWLRWLSSEFEALAARRRVGIRGWNSSACTKERREERREGTSFDFLICSFSDTILAMQHVSFIEVRQGRWPRWQGQSVPVDSDPASSNPDPTRHLPQWTNTAMAPEVTSLLDVTSS